MVGVRAWADELDPDFQADFQQAIRSAFDEAVTHSAERGSEIAVLVLSGGGSHGAFGAGFLAGWSERGSRPTFQLVTGISTGALMAPFAFLGPEYDDLLEEMYTTVRRKDVLRFRNPLALPGKDSLAKSRPLADRIADTLGEPELAAIAEEHRRGRRLLVATTNLDARRLVIWNMGAIAASGAPGALELFRGVLLASASIPVVFPPVYVTVVADGERYDEMHVDGGVISMFFVSRAAVDLADAIEEVRLDPEVERSATIYVIRNGKIENLPRPVKPRLLSISQRAGSVQLDAIADADAQRIRRLASDLGIGLKYAGIPAEVDPGIPIDFDPETMRRLFETGKALARSSQPWSLKSSGDAD
jgi:predicted acylesterase/phospholipase RssA